MGHGIGLGGLTGYSNYFGLDYERPGMKCSGDALIRGVPATELEALA